MRLQLTRIEELDRQYPEKKVELEVSRMLRGGDSHEEIRASIKNLTGEDVPLTTISNYKQRRWLKRKARIERLVEGREAILKLLGEHGSSEIIQSELHEQLDELMRDGARLDAPTAFKELRLWAQHEAKLAELENEKRRLGNENARLQQAEESKKQQAGKAIADGEKDPQRAIERIREIYGLAPAA